MDEARKDPESIIFQDPCFSLKLDWSPKKKTKLKEQEKSAYIGWDLARAKNYHPV